MDSILIAGALLLATLATPDVPAAAPVYKSGEWIEVTGPTEVTLPDRAERPGFTFVADHDPEYAGPLRTDSFLLQLPDVRGHGRPPIKIQLESRDSSLRVAFADLTGDGVEELVTVCCTARSSEARDEILQVWVWNERPFFRVLDVLVKGNLPAPWSYTPSFRDANADGVLDLQLTRDGPTSVNPTGPAYLIPPPGPSVSYGFDRTERKLKPIDFGGKVKGSSNNRMNPTTGGGLVADRQRRRSPAAGYAER